MALALLSAVSGKKPLEHTPGHDLESIVYVLGYTVLRRVVSSAGCPKTLEEVFKKCFGQETVSDIASQRMGCQPLTWLFAHEGDAMHIRKHMSGIMGELFLGLKKAIEAVHQQNAEAALAKLWLVVRSFSDMYALRLIMVSATSPCTRCPIATPPYPQHHPGAVTTGDRLLQRAP